MRIGAVIRLVSLLVMVFSFTLVPPIVVDLIYHENMISVYVITLFVSLSMGGGGLLLTHQIKQDIKVRDGFLVVMLFWLVLSFLGMLPFVMGEHPVLGWLDGFFESASGWTTTGSTVIKGIENLPHSLLYYRQQLQFLGGMGIIVLAVAILPMLGVGGMQLYQAEMPGPLKNHKLTPRIAETAKALWMIYVGLTIVCILAYVAAGMPWFNAIGEAFSTVATGGFSTHDSSFNYYSNPWIHWIAIVFMLLSSLNYGLHFAAVHKGDWRCYMEDVECRTFIKTMMLASVTIVTFLIVSNHYLDHRLAFLDGVFTTVSIMTTTGLTNTTFHDWPLVPTALLMWLGVVGGCAASTSGGVKQIRVILMRKQSLLTFNRLIHPQGVYCLHFGERPISQDLMQSVYGFIFAFIAIFFVLLLLLLGFGLDLNTSVGCLVACLANVGVGIGSAASSFADLNDPCKLTLIFAMFVGRLEIFTVFVLFMPEYWRH